MNEIVDGLSTAVPIRSAIEASHNSLRVLDGYLQHFGQAPSDPPSPEALDDRSLTPAELLELLDSAGVHRAMIWTEYLETALGVTGASNDELAEYIDRGDGRLYGIGGVDPWRDDAPETVETAVEDLGLKGILISPFKQGLDENDPRLSRVLGACEQREVPVLIHAGINWWVDAPYDVGHPRLIDQVASSFKNLNIVALHAGWPWVMDMVVVAWRHANVYIDMSSHRPKHMGVSGAGWEPLIHFGSRTIARKVLFGSTWPLLNMELGDIVAEMQSLPVSDEALERWMSTNAMELYAL